MSKLGNNLVLKKATGKLGDLIVFRQGPHGPVISSAPKKPANVHEKQVAIRERFLNAVQYAQRQMAKPESKALYEAGVNKKLLSAYQVAVTDYLNAPRIKQIDVEGYSGDAGQSIHVHATDDFSVASVTVIIRNAAGEQIERGTATLSTDLGNVWVYTTTASIGSFEGATITVNVKDNPGNAVTQTLTL